jgi:hypothetical protein
MSLPTVFVKAGRFPFGIWLCLRNLRFGSTGNVYTTVRRMSGSTLMLLDTLLPGSFGRHLSHNGVRQWLKLRRIFQAIPTGAGIFS